MCFITEYALSCRGEVSNAVTNCCLKGFEQSRVVEFLSDLELRWQWLGPAFGSQNAIETMSVCSKVEGFNQDKQKSPSDWLAKQGEKETTKKLDKNKAKKSWYRMAIKS